MKNLILLGLLGLSILSIVPQLNAQEKKVPATTSKTQAQINKFEDENLRLTVEHIKRVKAERIKQISNSTEERIKAAKAKTLIHKSMGHAAGADAPQKLQAKLQEIDTKLTQSEKAATAEFKQKQKKQNEEFIQKMKKRRDDFSK